MIVEMCKTGRNQTTGDIHDIRVNISYRDSVELRLEILVMTGESSNILRASPLLATIRSVQCYNAARHCALWHVTHAQSTSNDDTDSRVKILSTLNILQTVNREPGWVEACVEALSNYVKWLCSDKIKKLLTIWFVCSSPSLRIFSWFSEQVSHLVPSPSYWASTHSNCPLQWKMLDKITYRISNMIIISNQNLSPHWQPGQHQL